MFWFSAVLVTHKNIPKILKINGAREAQETENYFVEYTLDILKLLSCKPGLTWCHRPWFENQSKVISFLWCSNLFPHKNYQALFNEINCCILEEIFELTKRLNPPLCKPLREKLHPCIKLSHSWFCDEAGPVPERLRENIGNFSSFAHCT